jgi:hypothetical protein
VDWMVEERVFELHQILAGRSEKRLAPDELAEYKHSGLRMDTGGRLFLSFRADDQVGEREKADLERLGAAVETSTADLLPFQGRSLVPPGYGEIAAWVPYNRVEAAADLPLVMAVSAAEMAHGDVGSVTSQGVRLHRANVAQAAHIDGSGVNVGVISIGANHVADSIATGDLPKGVVLLGGDPGIGAEGTAMMEVVHDMAPGAKLVFHPASGCCVDTYVAALRSLAVAGADVIAEDIAYDREPAFAQGIAVHATQEMAKAGIAIFGSAGNLGDGHAPRIRAVGSGGGPGGNSQFHGCTKPPSNVVSVFEVQLSGGTPIYATLQWSEPPTHAFTNLDLYLMDESATDCLAQSLSHQGGGVGKPLEYLEYVNQDPDEPLTVKLVVNLVDASTAAAAPLIDLRWRTDGEDDHSIMALSPLARAGSLNPNANFTALATSVAAANASVTADPASVPLESFSAAGPVVLETTTVCPHGLYPCQEGVAGPEPFVGGGPAWTAADRVNVSGAGGFEKIFIGTSAAAPHAAGCAALIRQQLETEGTSPTLSAIQERLANLAVSHHDPANWGAGVLICYPLAR